MAPQWINTLTDTHTNLHKENGAAAARIRIIMITAITTITVVHIGSHSSSDRELGPMEGFRT